MAQKVERLQPRWLLIVLFLSVGFIFPVLAVAEKESSVVLEEDKVIGPTGPISFSYYGVYTGPSLKYPGDRGSVDSDTGRFDREVSQNLANQLKLDYNFTKDFFAGPMVAFKFEPFAGSAFVMQDSGVRVGHHHIIETETLFASADLRFLLTMDPEHRAHDQKFSMQSWQEIAWDFHPRWTLSLSMIHNFQGYGADGERDPAVEDRGMDWQSYIAPTLTYQLSKTVFASVTYEMYPLHYLGSSWDEWTARPADFAPGISWDIAPTLNLTPQLIFYPSNLSLDAMGTTLTITARFI